MPRGAPPRHLSTVIGPGMHRGHYRECVKQGLGIAETHMVGIPGRRVVTTGTHPRGATLAVSATALLAAHLGAPGQASRYVAYTALATLAAYTLRRGIDRHQPRHPRGWQLLETGLWLHTAYGVTLLGQVLLPAASGLVIVESVVDNAAHLFMAAAAARFLSIRRPGRGHDGLLDAAVVLVAGGLLFWQVHEQQQLLVGTLTVPVLSAAAVALVMTAAVVIGVRLYVTDRPPLAFPVLVLAATVALTGNLVIVVTRPPGSPPRWVELLWLIGVLLAALAAHLPGMQLLGEPEGHRERHVSPSRVIALGAALLVSPALLVLWGTRVTSHPGRLACVVALLTVLVLWRIGRLISEREQMRRELGAAQAQLLYQATHDPLTELPNRALFLARVAASLTNAAAGRPPGPHQPVVLFLDLDGFKTVNDTHGHAAGDELLTAVAARLRACLRHDDLAARLGGDEFALLVDTSADRDTPLALARRILLSLNEPIALHAAATPIIIGASLGIAYAAPHATGLGEDATSLLSRADAAMYTAKRNGKNHYQVAEASALTGPAVAASPLQRGTGTLLR